MELFNLDLFWIVLVFAGMVVAVFLGVLVGRVLLRTRNKRQESAHENTQPSRTIIQENRGESSVDIGSEYGLQFIRDSGAKTTFHALPVSIGQSNQNDLVLDHPSVSARHARLYYDERLGAVCIQDLDSAKGTWINGHPTRRNVLQDGVRVRFGDVGLVFRDTGYLHPGSL